MPFYKDATQFETCAQALFDHMRAEKSPALEKLVQSHLVIRFCYTDPAGQLVIDATRPTIPVTFGKSTLTPTLDFVLPTDYLHQILLGHLTVTKALGSGKVTFKGSTFKAIALAPLFYHSQTIYPEILRRHGLA